MRRKQTNHSNEALLASANNVIGCDTCDRHAVLHEYLNFTKVPGPAKDGVLVFSARTQDRLGRGFIQLETRPKVALGVRANNCRYGAAASI